MGGPGDVKDRLPDRSGLGGVHLDDPGRQGPEQRQVIFGRCAVDFAVARIDVALQPSDPSRKRSISRSIAARSGALAFAR
jgi:hypothetical protein